MGAARHPYPAQVLFENLEAGMSIDEVIEQFPVTREQIDSLMAFIARSLEKTPVCSWAGSPCASYLTTGTARTRKFSHRSQGQEARQHGLEELANGELIDAAEQAGSDVMVTTDKNIRYQQNLTKRKIAIVVLERPKWPLVKLVAESIAATVDLAQAGGYVEVPVPLVI